MVALPRRGVAGARKIRLHVDRARKLQLALPPFRGLAHCRSPHSGATRPRRHRTHPIEGREIRCESERPGRQLYVGVHQQPRDQLVQQPRLIGERVLLHRRLMPLAHDGRLLPTQPHLLPQKLRQRVEQRRHIHLHRRLAALRGVTLSAPAGGRHPKRHSQICSQQTRRLQLPTIIGVQSFYPGFVRLAVLRIAGRRALGVVVSVHACTRSSARCSFVHAPAPRFWRTSQPAANAVRYAGDCRESTSTVNFSPSGTVFPRCA